MITDSNEKLTLKEESKRLMNGQAKLSPSFLNWIATLVFGAGVVWASILQIPSIKSRQAVLEDKVFTTQKDIAEIKTDIKWICNALKK